MPSQMSTNLDLREPAHSLFQNVSYQFSVINSFSIEPGAFGRTEAKKVPVPNRDEKPIMGLVSDKNFIVSNAVENILAAPNLPSNKDKDYLKKKNYGRVPKYL